MATTYTLRIAPVPKGDFSSAASYSPLDIVRYNGASYICVTAHSGEWDEENWQLLCENGADGAAGTAASITVGETTTGEAGAEAQVTNSGTETAVVLNFTIPKGEKGDTGDAGPQGPKGDTGEGFSITKTYPSIDEMNEDAASIDEGCFVLIASDVEDEDNAKLYVKGADAFTFLTDLSGAQGIKGEKGDTGETGEQGPQGPAGADGQDGEDGAAAGFGTPAATAATLDAGADATVEVTASGDDTAKVFAFSFGIPKGEKGEKGDQGEQGPAGEQGPQGEAGPAGADGANGVGIVSISSVDENGEITITLE